MDYCFRMEHGMRLVNKARAEQPMENEHGVKKRKKKITSTKINNNQGNEYE